MEIQYNAGGVIGRKHRLYGLNYQDSHHAVQSDTRFVGVATNGLSLLKTQTEEIPTKSEFGAIIGANLVADVVGNLSLRISPERERDVFTGRQFWSRVEDDVLAHLRTTALLFGGSLYQVIETYFLFTSLGVLITPNWTVLFGLGDGKFFINGEAITLGPFPGNEPPYLAHRLLPSTRHKKDDLQYKVYKILPTVEVQNFMVGTDGVNDLIANEKKLMPGRTEPVGPISQFWEQDVYFKEPAAIELRLNMIGDDRDTIDWQKQKVVKQPGLLPDDTTMMVGRLVKEV